MKNGGSAGIINVAPVTHEGQTMPITPASTIRGIESSIYNNRVMSCNGCLLQSIKENWLPLQIRRNLKNERRARSHCVKTGSIFKIERALKGDFTAQTTFSSDHPKLYYHPALKQVVPYRLITSLLATEN